MKKYLINIALFLSSFIFLFIILEIIFSFLDYSVFKGEFTITFDNNTVLNNNDGLVYDLDNNIVESRYLQTYPRNLDKKKKAEDIRIVILGDSFTDGAGLFDKEEKYTRKLYEKFLENSNQNVEIITLCYDGLNTMQEYRLFELIGLKYEPDFLVLQYTDNDVETNRSLIVFEKDYSTIVGEDKKTKRTFEGLRYTKTDLIVVDDMVVPIFGLLSLNTNKLLLKNSAFLRFISYKINVILVKNNIFYSKGYKDSFDNLSKLKKISQENNIPFIVFYTPPTSDNENYCGKTNFNFREKLKQHIEKLGVSFLSMCDFSDNLNDLQSQRDLPYPCHYNEEGHEIIANELYFIINNNI